MTMPTRASRFMRAGLAALAVAALIPISAAAQSTGRPALKRAAGTPIVAAALGQLPRTVVLKMSGDPVALVRSRAPGKQLAPGQRESIELDLRARQDAIVPTIQKMGGTVLAQFQHALNGIKVRGTPEQIRSFTSLPGVVAVKPVRFYHLDNAHSVPFIGAPQAWQGPPGLHGEHVRIAVIDTGVDYTHANFGGPGTVAAYNAAFASSTQPADPSLFGPDAPKVRGGIDLVGDAYTPIDPNHATPTPDPNPLDCNGHGSHTSGTATGFGVTTAGATFTGLYDGGTPSQSFTIGPGVAPLADLYAVRVFGCTGGSEVVVDGIEWAVAHDMQVISMSLGADFGPADDADAEAGKWRQSHQRRRDVLTYISAERRSHCVALGGRCGRHRRGPRRAAARRLRAGRHPDERGEPSPGVQCQRLSLGRRSGRTGHRLPRHLLVRHQSDSREGRGRCRDRRSQQHHRLL